MWKRLSSAAFAALIISAIITGTAWAAFAWSSYTGPTIIQDNGNGTWNVQWTIVVTTLSGNDNRVCVTTSAGQVGDCGTTTGILTCVANNVPNSSIVTWDISSYSGACGSSSKQTQGPTGTISPLAVTLATFTADASADGVTLAWETVSETDNAGFNVYRADSDAGPWTRLNPALIPAAAPGSSEGHAYTWTDAAAQPGASYWYLLEDVALDGATTQHAPVQVAAAAEPNAVGLAAFGATATGPSLTGLAALALVALAGAGTRKRW